MKKLLNGTQALATLYILGLAGASDMGTSLSVIIPRLFVAVAIFAITTTIKKSALLTQKRTSLRNGLTKFFKIIISRKCENVKKG